MRIPALAVALIALAACDQAAKAPAPLPAPAEAPRPAAVAPAPVEYPRVDPCNPGTSCGLPDDRTPLSEAPYTPESAQGAGEVLQTYFALLGAGKFDDAWKLTNGAKDRDAFVAEMKAYRQYSAEVGAPGQIEGAAGSLYIEIPVQVYGRTAEGMEFHRLGKAMLRRVNNVDGSTAEQRRWRIQAIELG